MITNKARIIQNTTHFTNDQIKYMIDFVNPFDGSELSDLAFTVTEAQSALQNLLIRIIYESERDEEFFDDGRSGSYIPCMTNFGPIITAIIPNSKEINFPTYSNYSVLKLFEEKKLKVTKGAMKELRQARYEIGHSVIVYLSFEELLIRIIAHELRHHWQELNKNFKKKIKMKINTKTKEKIKKQIKLEREKDADRYAVRQVRLWRKLHHVKDAYPAGVDDQNK